MNGLYELNCAESLARERARGVDRRAAEDLLIAGVVVDHPVRTRLGRGLIRLGTRLAPQVEPPRRPRTNANC